MRKWLSVLLAFLIPVSLISCSKADKDVAQTTTTQTAQVTEEEPNPFEEFYEITWLTQLNADWKDGRWDELELEEMFNIDLKVWPMDSYNDYESVAALIAAGEIADFMRIPRAPMEPWQMYEQKLIRSIPLEMFKNYLPGYYRLLEMMPIGFKYNLVDGTTDQYLGITNIGFASAQYFYDATAVNLDWLEAIGYSIPEADLKPIKIPTEGYEKWSNQLFVTDGKFTFEEMNDMLKKFTENDPDGNGQDDTFGMLYLPEAADSNMTQEGLFGFCHEPNYLYKDPVTGDIVPREAYTPYRDYLLWISESLTKGYIQRLPGIESWYTEYQQLTRTNKIGIIQIHRDGYLYPTNSTYANLPPQSILLDTDPTARFVIGPMFYGPYGTKNGMAYSIDTFGTGAARVEMIGGQVDDGKLERILRMLQYIIYTSEDIFYRYHLGIEGIHWKWAGEPYQSAKIIVPQEDLPEQYRGNTKVFTCWLMQWPTAEADAYNALTHGYWSMPAFMYAYDLYEKYALKPAKYISEVYMGKDLYMQYREIRDKVSDQMAVVAADFKQRALSGQITDIRSEWSQYIDQLYAAGLQELVDKIFNNPAYEPYYPGDKFKIKGPLY
jgi:putative aldouronate transport system substrate-binding protein